MIDRKILLLFIVFFAVLARLNACTNISICQSVLGNTGDQETPELLYDDTGDTDHRGHTKYEFIAAKLGILGNQPETISTKVSKILTSLQYPCMIGAYISAIFFIEHEELELSGSQDVDILVIGFIASVITSFLLSTSAHYLNKQQKKITHFNDFIVNWPTYKTETPDEVYQIFDELHQQYLHNKNCLDVSEDFVDEIFKRVTAACVNDFLVQEAKQGKV